MYDEKRYLIPLNIKTRQELFDGVGFKELGIILIVALIGLVISLILRIFTNNTLIFMIPILLGFMAFMFFKLGSSTTGISYTTRIKLAKDFLTKQKRFKYVHGTGRK